jgi:hypothetical protein
MGEVSHCPGFTRVEWRAGMMLCGGEWYVRVMNH